MLLVLAVGLNACQGSVASIVSNPSALSIGNAIDSQTGLNADIYGNPLLLDANNNLLLSENNVKIQPSLAWGIAESFASQFNSTPSFSGLEYEHDRFVYIFKMSTNQTFTYNVGVPIVSNEMVFFVDVMTGDVIDSNGCGMGPGTIIQKFNPDLIQSVNNSPVFFQFPGLIIPETSGFNGSVKENFTVKNQTIETSEFAYAGGIQFNVSTPFKWTAVLLSDTPVVEMVSGFSRAVIFNDSGVYMYSINPGHMSVGFQNPSEIQNSVSNSSFEFSIPLSALNLSEGNPFSVMLLAGDDQNNAFGSMPEVFWLGSRQNVSVLQEYPLSLHLLSSLNVSGSVVNVTAFQWGYKPDTITVKQGDNVTLYLTSSDVTHGFELDAFGINAEITPGQITTVNFIADKPGTFTFYCSVFCGSGHSTMRGTLIVLPSNSTSSVASNTDFFNFFNVILILAFVLAVALAWILIKKRRV